MCMFYVKLSEIFNEYLRKKNLLKRHVCISKALNSYLLFALVHVALPSSVQLLYTLSTQTLRNDLLKKHLDAVLRDISKQTEKLK